MPSHTDSYNTDLFFELSLDLHFIAGYDGYLKKVNPAVIKTLGYSEEELYSRPINEFIHPDDRTITSEHRQNIHKNKPLLNFENRYITKSGEIVWLSWTSMPYQSEQLVYAIAKNVTHLKNKEEDRNLLVSGLTEMNKNFKNLTFTISHDLRPPINNILSLINFIDRSKINDNSTIELIDLLKHSGIQLKSTVDSYITKLTQDSISNLSIETVSISAALERVSQSIHNLIVDTNSSIESDFSAFDKISFNKAYLDSILLNLITNAIKYVNVGTTPHLVLRTQILNGEKQLLISDNGQGFNLEKIKNKIFGLHQKFHSHSDSNGIGLYLVYTHIKNLGGNITLESEVGKGTTFTITFVD